MQIVDVLKGLDFRLVLGELDKEISGIAYDSRVVETNSLFVAITGFRVDGHQFIRQAVQKGASTIMIERDLPANELEPLCNEGITLLKVNNSRKALALVSANYFEHPSRKLKLIGITGTNGKTSITYFLKSILEEHHQKVGIIGTMGTLIDQQLSKNRNTTPESREVQEILARMVARETNYALMEVSSHALALDRVAYTRFNTAVFTNLSPDHLELHQTMEEYFQAKAKLFQLTSDVNIVNLDDPYGERLAAKLQGQNVQLLTYGIDHQADIYATDIHYTSQGSQYLAHTPTGSIPIDVHLPGKIYVYNSLAALACAYREQIPLPVIASGIANVNQIKGRFEIVYRQDDYQIIVDFAHTEDALEKALTTLRPYAKGRLILVFGVYAAPGELGRAKREAMGRVAAKHADLAIVTSDNPKDQNPEAIIDEIATALAEAGGRYKTFVDRQEAIEYAIEVSTNKDIILIAGKGHETSQVIGEKEIPFNEAEIVLETIKNRKQAVSSK